MNRHTTKVVLAGLVAALLLGVLGLGWRAARSDTEDKAENTSGSRADSEPSVRRPRHTTKPDIQGVPVRASVSGMVSDNTRAPLAGAQVCAWPGPGDWKHQPIACTRSLSDGSYRLDGLEKGEIRLDAEASGFLPQRWRRQHDTWLEEELRLKGGETVGIDFMLSAGGKALRGIVRDISGGVVEGARVWAGSSGFSDLGRSIATTDAGGAFELWLSPGRVKLHTSAEGYADGSQLGAVPGPTFEIFIVPESAISGRVVWAGTEEGVGGVEVRADALGFGNHALGLAHTDDQGRFELNRLSPGIYDVHGRGSDCFGKAPESVHLGLSERGEVLIEVHPAFLVSGRVEGEDGPCPEGMLTLKDGHTLRSGRVRDGEVELGGLVAGAYRVRVKCSGAVLAPEYPDVVVIDHDIEGLTWPVSTGLGVRGEVIDAKGAPLGAARVVATVQSEGSNERARSRAGSALTNSAGQFALRGLSTGTYSLSVSPWGARDAAQVELGAENVEGIQLQVESLGAISGTVIDTIGTPVPHVHVVARVDGRRLAAATSDNAGRFRLAKLPPGEVEVMGLDGSGPLHDPSVVSVGPSETAELEIRVSRRDAAIRGVVHDREGAPVEDAFVRVQRQGDAGVRAPSIVRWDLDRPPVLTDTDGSFEVVGLMRDASYLVSAIREGGGEATVEASAGESTELVLVDTGGLRGIVVDDVGEPVERFRVTVRRRDGLIRTEEPFRTRGRFSLEKLPPGTYSLLVEARALRGQQNNIVVEPGESEELRLTVE